MMTAEWTALNQLEQNYQNALITLSHDPAIADAYNQILGYNMITTAKTAYQSYLEFVSTNPIPGGTTSGGVSPIGGSNTSNIIPTQNTVEVPGATLNTSNVNTAQLRHQLTGYATGTDYVPNTGLYMLHRGEAVIPEGKQGGGSPIIININNPVVNNQNDIAKLASSLDTVIKANLIDKQTGRSKFRSGR